MKANILLVLIIIGLGLILPRLIHGAGIDADPVHFVAAGEFDLEKLLAPPPGNYSPETAAELRQILQLQKALTPEQTTEIRTEDALTPSIFCGSLFSKWSEPEASKMTALLSLVADDAQRISDNSKLIWDRPRPSRLEKNIAKLVDLPSGSSYPGSSSTIVYTWAALLVSALPDRKDEIMSRADQIAQNRVAAGVQYPSDVAAGKVLGLEIGKRLLAKPEFQTRLHDALADLQMLPAVSYVSTTMVNPGLAP